MAQQTTVLIAMDPSDHSLKALKWYIERFYNPSHKVILCHVPEYWANVQRMISPGRLEELIKETKENTEKLKTTCDAILKEKGIESQFEVVHGEEVWHEICKLVKTLNADMVVMGTRGMGTIKRTILGSVSDGVLHHGHVPILVYKE